MGLGHAGGLFTFLRKSVLWTSGDANGSWSCRKHTQIGIEDTQLHIICMEFAHEKTMQV